MKQFEYKPCISIGRGSRFPITVNILRKPEEIRFFREWAINDLELPWFTIIVIANF